MKICAQCGNHFTPKTKNQIYCCHECYYIDYKEKKRLTNALKPSSNLAAKNRRLASRNKNLNAEVENLVAENRRLASRNKNLNAEVENLVAENRRLHAELKKFHQEKFQKKLKPLPVLEKTCPQCLQSFQTKNPSQLFCSVKCYQKYHHISPLFILET